MKNFRFTLIGLFFGMMFFACAGGSKRPDYSKFPKRSDIFSVYMKCVDGDIKNVCKNVCDKYKKNVCLERHVERKDIHKLLDEGSVILSKSYFLQLTR